MFVTYGVQTCHSAAHLGNSFYLRNLAVMIASLVDAIILVDKALEYLLRGFHPCFKVYSSCAFIVFGE